MDRLKKAKSVKRKVETVIQDDEPDNTKDPMSEADNQKVLSIRDKLKGNLSKSTHVKEERAKSLEDESEQYILISINVGDNLAIAKILKLSKKYEDSTGMALVFSVKSTDGNYYILETEFKVGNCERFAKLMEKVVGVGNARITESEW